VSMTAKQRNELDQQLRARFDFLKKEIREELLRSEDERYTELAGRVHDSGDEAVADLLADVSLAVIDQHIHEIQDLEAALQRMQTASYGVCIDCDNDIAYRRLRAYPTAKRCRDCQVAYERSRPQLRRPVL
jgi:DnaK suppressor protein